MTVSMIFLLVLAVFAANIPFMSNRFLLLMPLTRKPFYVHFFELILFYILIGLLARVLEGQVGVVHSQDWQFYVATMCLFAVFAFPGFVLRFFWKSRA